LQDAFRSPDVMWRRRSRRIDKAISCNRLGLAGAEALRIWTVRRCFIRDRVLIASAVRSARVQLAAEIFDELFEVRFRMTIVKKMLSTDMLPPGLDDRQRFLRFAELFEHFSNTGELDPAPDLPFQAAMNSIHIGTTMLGRCDGTFTAVRREYRQVLETNDDRYCLARNTGRRAAQVIHRGQEFALRPGAMVLLRLDEPFFSADGSSHKRFTNVHLPTSTLRTMVPDVDDMVGCELAPGGALSLAMDYSNLLLDHPDAVNEAGPAIATHLLDLAAIGLGARGDLAMSARRGGLRAVRLKAVLAVLQRRFTEPDFSAQKLAAAAGLSERYVNELLYEAGASFTTRLNELRLRKAAALLLQGDRRISDIAFECGFNDLSYFNRCFRRRFGLTPTAARGK
jgi:AraC-like DNA-binding protein